ncbi:MAG: RloB family protein [Bacteroidia bacterium]
MTRKQPIQPKREAVAIVGDGQTERIYFADVKDTDRPATLAIFPDYPRTIGSYAGVLKRAVELADKDYDHVFALIDMDKIFQDNQQAAYLQAKAAARARGIIVLENNPCFELWILLHFVHTGRLFQNCGEVEHEIKKAGRLQGYDKSEKFQVGARLYANYRDRLKDAAVPNARLLENNRADKDQLYPRAEIFRFFEWYLGMDAYIAKNE